MTSFRFDMTKNEPIDWDEVTISRQDLITWLISKNVKPAFFATDIQQRALEEEAARANARAMRSPSPVAVPTQPVPPPAKPGYLDTTHPRYTPKLAAAVKAWLAVTEQPGKTPSQAIRAWLERHASELELIKDDGTLNRTAIEEIAKIANWKPEGGVPKTPG